VAIFPQTDLLTSKKKGTGLLKKGYLPAIGSFAL
jgi:hypothetical protein